METKREREDRLQQQQWAAQELRYGLEQAGWIAPHSFKLRNSMKNGRYYQVRSYHFKAGEPNIAVQKERSMPRAERLRIYRECGYYMNYDDAPTGGSESTYDTLEQQLYYASIKGYTEIIHVGTSFLDTSFLLGRPVRSITEMLSHAERRDLQLLDYQVISPYRGGPEPLIVVPMQEPVQGDGWYMHVQDAWRHIKLVRYVHGEVAEIVQWEDDPYLVNIAEEYLKLLLFRATLPFEERYSMHRADMLEQLKECVPYPYGAKYSCPSWMEHILHQGYY